MPIEARRDAGWRPGLAAAMLGLALAWPGPALPAGTDGREFDCVLKPSREVRLSVPVSGVIESVRVDRGDRVAKCDVVASLDPDVERTAVALAKRRAEATAKIESGEAQFDMDLARLELVRSEALLRRRTVRSPVDGVVVERKLSPGEYWSDREPVVTIASLDPLYVETFVPVALHGRIRRGDTAFIPPEEPIKGRYTAEVDVVDHVYHAAGGTLSARNRPGALGRAALASGSRGALRNDRTVGIVTRVIGPSGAADVTFRPVRA